MALNGPLQLIITLYDCMLTKQNFFWYFDAGLEHMAARSLGNETFFPLAELYSHAI